MASHAQPVAVAPVTEALPVAQGHLVTVQAHEVPSPAAMVREDISEEARKVLKSHVGTWKAPAETIMGCMSIKSEFTIGALSEGVYPMTGVMEVSCCGCIPLKTVTETGTKEESGASWRKTTSDGSMWHGTRTKIDEKAKTAHFDITGTQGKGTQVINWGVKPMTNTTEITADGHRITLRYVKVD